MVLDLCASSLLLIFSVPILWLSWESIFVGSTELVLEVDLFLVLATKLICWSRFKSSGRFRGGISVALMCQPFRVE